MKNEYNEIIEEISCYIRHFIYSDVEENPNRYPLLTNTTEVINIIRNGIYPRDYIEIFKNNTYDFLVKEVIHNLK